MKDALGDRIKSFYEDRSRIFLPRKSYYILRIDGKAFHSYTRNLHKPFDQGLIEDFQQTTLFLCKNIQGAQFGYCQSDEITIVISDLNDIKTDLWFDGNIQKITSVAASMATAEFNKLRMIRFLQEGYEDYDKFIAANFDCRVFQVPLRYEVLNVLEWRQQDATRNSINSVAQSLCSHKELQGKKLSETQELIFQKSGFNWNDLPAYKKRGTAVYKKKSEFIKAVVGLCVETTSEDRKKFYSNMNADENGIVWTYNWTIDKDIPIFHSDWKWFNNKII